MDRTVVRLVVRGRVQGVGYRWWARKTAARLRLDGWARNRIDGSVELVVAGLDDAVEDFIQRCWKGPKSADVTAIDRFEAQDEGFEGFETRRTT